MIKEEVTGERCCPPDLLQRQDVGGETGPSEHRLKLSHLHPPVLHTLTYSATLWERKHTTFSKLLGVKIKHILCDALLDQCCTIDEDDAWREPQLLVRGLTQTLQCINRKEQTQNVYGFKQTPHTTDTQWIFMYYSRLLIHGLSPK